MKQGNKHHTNDDKYPNKCDNKEEDEPNINKNLNGIFLLKYDHSFKTFGQGKHQKAIIDKYLDNIQQMDVNFMEQRETDIAVKPKKQKVTQRNHCKC